MSEMKEEHRLSKKEESLIAEMINIGNKYGMGAKRHCAAVLRSYPENNEEFISTSIYE